MHAPGAPSARVAHLVAVCNLKGGTGKSTLSVNLACALSEGGAAVALVDNDEQGSSSLWAGAGKLPVRCLHLPLLRAEGFAPWMRQLVELRAGHDILVVDFPAGVAPALAATLLMSSAVLVPCAPSGIEVAATRRMTRHLARLRAERPADPPAVMIVPTRVGEGGLTASGFRERLAAFGEELAPAVPLDATFDAAYASGDWVGGHAPGSVAHAEVAASRPSSAAASPSACRPPGRRCAWRPPTGRHPRPCRRRTGPARATGRPRQSPRPASPRRPHPR